MTTLVRDLFALPTEVGKTEFVVKLTEALRQPEETTRLYVATQAIVHGPMKDALGLIKRALDQGTSQGTFVHGSFGSGKSHFISVMSLLAADNPSAWAIPDFHPLRPSFDFVGKKKLLQLPFHMIGQKSLEGAVFGEYLRFVRREVPDAPLPALFSDDRLFADAQEFLVRLGPEKFFAPMNAAAPSKAKWGALAQAWDQARFDKARTASDPKLRQELYSALVKSHFKSAAEQTEGFIDFDTGLLRISAHAQSLGYDAIVLLLDELVLWLASRASETDWLHTEAQKMVKLVEAQHSERPIPIVSFIARQRDIDELVEEVYAGYQQANLKASLTWSKGRFQTIYLPDSQLPEIVARRVVTPKDDAAKGALDDAFKKVEQTAGKSWNTLLGEADAAAFRKVYPFSPVLVETLVGLSSALQRERTALKLLMELLVEHVSDLKVGDIVAVGDLFDVLAGGDDTTDGAMRQLFDSAKDLYRNQLLPLIWAKHGTGNKQKCQRMRETHKPSLGCSGCVERLCRRDNRLAKTLILASLVNKVPAFKNLTVNKLAALNHGTLGKMPVPGQENVIVAQIVRDWAAQNGQIRIGDQADPSVSVELAGVNVDSILARVGDKDTPQACRRVIRDLLFDALQIPKSADDTVPHKVSWRGSDRRGAVRFANVRTLQPEQIACPEELDWYLILDYPFDEPGHGPNEDIEVATGVREQGTGTWTLAWLPSFLSDANYRQLREIAKLDYLMQDSATTATYLNHLTVEQQARARTQLESLRSQKRTKLRNLLEQAYGIAQPVQTELDTSRLVDDHVMLLKPGIKLHPSLPPNLATALEHYVHGMLDRRYPRAPALTVRPTKAVMGRMIDFFERLLETPEKKLAFADKDVRGEVQGLLEPLGLVSTTENAALLYEEKALQTLENTRMQQAVDTPTVEQVRRWLDPKQHMGLPDEVADIAIRAYARWAARTLVRNGQPFEPQVGSAIPDNVELEKPPLPLSAEWAKALELAGHTFGLTFAGKALHADNLKRFEAELKKHLADTSAVAVLPDLVAQWLAKYGGDVKPHRLATAKSASSLCAHLAGKDGLGMVQALAAFEPETSARAVGSSIKRAKETREVLASSIYDGIFTQLSAKGEGAELRAQLREALGQDELNVELAPRVKELATAGQALLIKPGPGRDDSAKPPRVGDVTKEGRARGAAELKAVIERLGAQALSQVGSDVGEVLVRIELHLEK